MFISVLIPAYNCAGELEKTVSSILCSGLSDFEVLLIDDGSSDGTAEVCDALVARYDNVRCIHQKNTGVSGARNRGIAEAEGEYIFFFDADDSVDPGSLVNAGRIVTQIRPDMLIFGLSFDYYFNGRCYRRDEVVYEEECLLDGQQWRAVFDKLYACNALSPVWNKFIRRDILLEHDIRFRHDLIEMEDFLFVVCCMARCDSIYVLPEAIYRYRQAEDEHSTFNRLLRIQSLSDYMRPFEDVAKYLGVEKLDAVVQQIYMAFLSEMMRFGSLDQIEKAARDMMSGPYAAVVKKLNSELYDLLAAKKYRTIQMRNRKGYLRHWLAVRAKYALNSWRNR